MNKLFLFIISIIVLSITTTPLLAQDTTDHKKMTKEVVEKFKKKFSKRVFIKHLTEIKEDHEEMVSRLKRFKDAKGQHSFKEDSTLIIAYTKSQKSFNSVLDLMIADIKETTSVLDYITFDANVRYKPQLKKAKKQGDEFLKSADKKLSGGDTKFVGKIFQWLFKVFPIIRKIEEVFLNHAKHLMIERIEAAKFLDWSKIQ